MHDLHDIVETLWLVASSRSVAPSPRKFVSLRRTRKTSIPSTLPSTHSPNQEAGNSSRRIRPYDPPYYTLRLLLNTHSFNRVQGKNNNLTTSQQKLLVRQQQQKASWETRRQRVMHPPNQQRVISRLLRARCKKRLQLRLRLLLRRQR